MADNLVHDDDDGFQLTDLLISQGSFELADVVTSVAFGNQGGLDLRLEDDTCSQLQLPDLAKSCPHDHIPVSILDTLSPELTDGQRGWIPGTDMGQLIGRSGVGKGNIDVQAQMLIANVFYSLKRLSSETLKVLLSVTMPVSQQSCRPMAAEVASRLCRVAGNTVRTVIHRLSQNGWIVQEPCSKRKLSEDKAAADSHADAKEERNVWLLLCEGAQTLFESNDYSVGTYILLSRWLQHSDRIL